MSLTGPIILLVVLLLAAILTISLLARHFAIKDKKIFEQIADKRKGELVIDSFTTWATVVFEHEQTEYTVYESKDGKAKKHLLEFTLRDVPSNVEELNELIDQGIDIITTVVNKVSTN